MEARARAADDNSRMSDHHVVGVAQMSVAFADVPKNLDRARSLLQQSGNLGLSLVVLPECALTGYMFDEAEAMRRIALRLDGPEVGSLIALCRELGLYAVVGLIEATPDAYYNTAVLLGPGGLIGAYRKTHLPWLGVDRFLAKGAPGEPPVFETSIGRVGIAICYDLRFPEFIRAQALRGADLVAIPTCWPPESRMLADDFMRVRACENRIYLLAADRGDSEGGADFIGRSQIVDPAGHVLVDTDRGETLLTAEIDLNQARRKRIVFRPGEFEVSLFEDRRPDLYTELTVVRGSGAGSDGNR